jgi:hypothetical protein
VKLLTQRELLLSVAARWNEEWDIGVPIGNTKMVRIYKHLIDAEQITIELLQELKLDESWYLYDCGGCGKFVEQVVQVDGIVLCKDCIAEAFQMIAGRQIGQALCEMYDNLISLPLTADLGPGGLEDTDNAINAVIEELGELMEEL